MLRILEMTDADIIEELAGDAKIAREALLKVKYDAASAFRTLALDLDDMNIRGNALSVAYTYAGSDHKKLIELCAARDAGMVDSVASAWPDMGVRRHGERKEVPMVDAAIRGILDEAKARDQLEKLDEGSEHVQKLFRTMLERMQHAKYFLSNFYLNLDNGIYAHFEITLKGLVGADGKPLADPKTDPTMENALLADALLEKSKAIPEAANEAIESAVDEFIAKQEDDTVPVMAKEGYTEIAALDLNTLSYILAQHEAAIKKSADPRFPIDPMADFRWAFFVTLSEMATIVDGLIAGGAGIDDLQAKHFKEGRAFLRLNNVFVQPELDEHAGERPADQPLNG